MVRTEYCYQHAPGVSIPEERRTASVTDKPPKDTHHHKIVVYGRRDTPPPGYLLFNPTSKGADPTYRRLSPFTLGPVEVEVLGKKYTSETMENAWQYLKQYACHREGPMTGPDGKKVDGTDLWLAWAKAGWANPVAVRFPMGRGARPLFSRWKDEKLGYIPSRYKVYCPLYAKAVETYAADVLNDLRAMYQRGEKIALFDFDGYDYLKLGWTLSDVINCPTRKMGHAFVLAALIESKDPSTYPWNAECP